MLPPANMFSIFVLPTVSSRGNWNMAFLVMFRQPKALRKIMVLIKCWKEIYADLKHKSFSRLNLKCGKLTLVWGVKILCFVHTSIHLDLLSMTSLQCRDNSPLVLKKHCQSAAIMFPLSHIWQSKLVVSKTMLRIGPVKLWCTVFGDKSLF